jgi:hypothetical protein
MTSRPDLLRKFRNMTADEIVEHARNSPAELEKAIAELRYRIERRPRKRLVRLLRDLERMRTDG